MRFLLLFLLSTTALGQGTVSSTCIWSGTVADCLPSDGLLLRNQRDLRLGESSANGVNYVAIQAPAALASDVTLTLPADDGDANEFLQTNGSGVLTWEPVDITTDITGVLPLANGGTAKALTAAAGGVVWTDADSFEVSAAGTANQVLKSNGTSAPSYGLIVNNNVDSGAAIEGSKIVSATGSVAGVVSLNTQTLGAGVKTVVALTVGTTDLTSGTVSQITQSNTGNTDYITKFFKNDGTIASGEAGGLKIGVADNDFNNYKWITFNKSMALTTDGTEIGYIGTNADATAIAYVTASDERLKTNFEPIENAIEKVMNIKPVMANWIGKENNKKQAMFIAQNLYETVPDAVTPGGEDPNVNPWGVDYGRVTPVLVQAIKDQQEIIESLKVEIKSLRESINQGEQ